MKESLVNFFSLSVGLRGGCALGVALAFSPVAGAQTNFSPLSTSGPVSNRYCVVFLAEGYRTNQYTQFLVDATNAVNLLLARQPYVSYSTHFNFYALAVPSVDSGSDHPQFNWYSNTFFNTTYDLGNFLLNMPTNHLGQGRVDSLLNTFLPTADLAILLVNDATPGGSDGGGRTALVSSGAATASSPFSYILVHETGHVVAGLGDEYTDALPYPDTEEPNTTRETNRAAIKWNAWIATNTPVPTPPTFDYLDVVGLFEGAHYHSAGWYRPQQRCLMRDATSEFCQVCREAMVLAFHQAVRPVDSFVPTNTSFSVASTQWLDFSLTLVSPADHALNVHWYTNNVLVTGATNSSLTLSPATLGNGSHSVQAIIADPTAWVRNDPSNRLGQTIVWSLNVSLPALTLSHLRLASGGGFAFRVSGFAPNGVSIHTSTNLVNWTAVSTNNLVEGQFDYTNYPAGNFLRRFFRAQTPPAP